MAAETRLHGRAPPLLAPRPATLALLTTSGRGTASDYTQGSVFHRLEKQIHAAFRDRLRAQFGVESDFALEQPRQPSFGEIAVPIAFQLAKSLKQPPKKIAGELVDAIGQIPGVSAMEVAGNGYINIRFDRGAYASALLKGDDLATPELSGKIIVEHTNINPN